MLNCGREMFFNFGPVVSVQELQSWPIQDWKTELFVRVSISLPLPSSLLPVSRGKYYFEVPLLVPAIFLYRPLQVSVRKSCSLLTAWSLWGLMRWEVEAGWMFRENAYVVEKSLFYWSKFAQVTKKHYSNFSQRIRKCQQGSWKTRVSEIRRRNQSTRNAKLNNSFF